MAKLTTAEFIEAIKELTVLELNDLVIRRALIEERVPMPDFLRFRKAFTPAQNHAAGTGFLPAGAEELPLAIVFVQIRNVCRKEPLNFLYGLPVGQIE